MNRHLTAALLGAVFAFALVLEGFGEMLIVMLGALVAWGVSRFLTGELDVVGFVERRSTGRR